MVGNPRHCCCTSAGAFFYSPRSPRCGIATSAVSRQREMHRVLAVAEAFITSSSSRIISRATLQRETHLRTQGSPRFRTFHSCVPSNVHKATVSMRGGERSEEEEVGSHVDVVRLLGCCVCACERAAKVIRSVEKKRRGATGIEGRRMLSQGDLVRLSSCFCGQC